MNGLPLIDGTRKDSLIRRRLLVGTTSNFVGQMLLFLVSFLLTPYVLTQLGAADYGLWILLGSIVTFGSILDFGLWGTVIKYVAEFQAREDSASARILLTTVLYLYIAIALLIVMGGIVLAPFLPRFFHLSPAQYQLASELIIVMSISTGVALPCLLPLAILRGLQRYELVNTIEFITTLVGAGVTVLVLWLNYGVIALALINIVSVVVSLMLGLWALHRFAPNFRFGWTGADWQMARRIGTYSWPLFLRDVGGRLQSKTDEITIGVFLPVSAVGSYNLARRLSETTQILTRQFMKTLLPLASQLHAEEDFPRLRTLYKSGTRLTAAIAFALGCTLTILAVPLLVLWVGPEYASLMGVVVILTVANVIATLQWPAMAVLQAMSRHRILAFLAVGNGIANLTLSLLLVRPFGLVGVAIGSVIPIAIEYFCVVLPYSLQVAQLSPREALVEIFMPALLPVAPMLFTLYVLKSMLEISSWWSLMGVALAGLLVYGAAYVAIGGNHRECQWLFRALSFGYRYVATNVKRG